MSIVPFCRQILKKFAYPLLKSDRLLGDKARARLGCRRVDGRYVVPSESTIRDVLIRVEPGVLDSALQQWNNAFAPQDQTLAVDGKTMCNAIDDKGHQTHIMSAVGHESAICYTQKKSALCL